MEPSAPAPWRVLEAPPAGDERPGNAGALPRTSGKDGEAHSMLSKLLVIIGLAAACAVGAFILAVGGGDGAVRVDGGTRIDDAASGAPVESGGAEIGGQGTTALVVEIVGAVRRPGVYRVPAGSRVGDLLEAAGGYGPRVDTAEAERALNLAAPLGDGDQVRVPSRDDPARSSLAPAAGGGAIPAAGAGAAPAAGAIDLNTATQAELEALPGVGPATALKIIAGREEAPFTAVEELRSRGILGEKTFEKLRELVTVG